jgi:carboxypeptidase D
MMVLIGNGIIDVSVQAEYYAEFAVNNTYGIQAYNDTIYSHTKFSYSMPNGCQNQIEDCRSVSPDDLAYHAICSEAQNMCRDNVEAMYYYFSGRGTYDIRHPSLDPEPPTYFVDYLNQAHVQNAIGVDLNYTKSNYMIYNAFQQSGDMVYRSFIGHLGAVIDSGVRVVLYYGDADYIVSPVSCLASLSRKTQGGA